jgi:hypothetical protein
MCDLEVLPTLQMTKISQRWQVDTTSSFMLCQPHCHFWEILKLRGADTEMMELWAPNCDQAENVTTISGY